MKTRLDFALFQQGVGEPTDQVGVLSVNHRHRAMGASQ